MSENIGAGSSGKSPVFSWNRKATPTTLYPLLDILAERYPIKESGNGPCISFSIGGEGLIVRRYGTEAHVAGANLSLIARGIGTLLSGFEGELQEKTPFNSMGLMLDCCRNAVPKTSYIKEWICRAALMGYNHFLLYTKDTYELPGEEIFGYLRGRYTAEELREIDNFAAAMGVEMRGCVQALGHLEPVLRWDRYAAIKDTAAELLTTEEESYVLIDKILDLYSDVYRSRLIHLGMDETHGLGRGRYMDINGYRRPFDIYIDHLNRVVKACDKRGLKSMIWSDMFFRMGSKTMDYYDMDAVTPPDVIARIPPNVKLTYWDYYHTDLEFYREWIRRHRSLGHTPVMASGIWTWPLFWYNHARTVATADPCIEACSLENIEEIFFTMWGDDGGYCDWSSAQAGACYVAEKLFKPQGKPDEKLLAAKFAAICGGDFAAHVTASRIDQIGEENGVLASALLWDDPLLGIYRKEFITSDAATFWSHKAVHFAQVASELRELPRGQAGDIGLIGELAELLSAKIMALQAAEKAPRASSTRQQAMEMAQRVERFEHRYRALWYERNKTQGYEVMQIRLAGQAARWRELARRLEAFADGDSYALAELAERPQAPAKPRLHYQSLATGSVSL